METTLLFYSSGFFGYGEEGNFKAYSLAHVLPLVIALIVILWIYKKRDVLRSWRGEENLRWIWAGIMLLVEMSFFWRILYVGPDGRSDPSLLTRLPLQVCQWMLMITAYMLMRKTDKVFSLTFYGTMTFGLLPLLLPVVITRTGPSYYRYYQYWLEHLMPIVGMYYMMFVHGYAPQRKKMLQAFIVPMAILPFALYFNARVEGAYYLYLVRGGIRLPAPLDSLSVGGSAAFLIVFGLLMMNAVHGIYCLAVKGKNKQKQK